MNTSSNILILSLRSLRTGFSVAGGFVLLLLAIDFGDAAATQNGLLAMLAVLFSIGMIFSAVRFALFALEGASSEEMSPVAISAEGSRR